MSTTRYRFRTRWWLPADPSAVFAMLADLVDYPRWWPDVRSVRWLDGDTAEVRARSSLPFTLVMLLHRIEEDERRGVLAVGLRGDLRGSLRVEVTRDGLGTGVEVVQEVEARSRLLRVLSPWARPLLRLNHAAMMRRGRVGLTTRLAGGAGRTTRETARR